MLMDDSPDDDIKRRLRLWWANQQVLVGLVLACLITAAVGAVVYLPVGPARIVTGTILGFGLRETDTGSYAIARVQLPDRVVLINLPRTSVCSLGERVNVQEQQRFWGPAFTLDWISCSGPH